MTGKNTVSLTKVASGVILYQGIPVVEHLENAGHSAITSRSLLGVLIVYAEAKTDEKQSVRDLYSSQINQIIDAGINIDKIELRYPAGWRKSLGLWAAKLATKWANKDGRGRKRIMTMRAKYGDDVFEQFGKKNSSARTNEGSKNSDSDEIVCPPTPVKDQDS